MASPIEVHMTENIQHLRNELLQLAEHSEDEVLLAQSCLVLRGEADTIIWPDKEN